MNWLKRKDCAVGLGCRFGLIGPAESGVDFFIHV